MPYSLDNVKDVIEDFVQTQNASTIELHDKRTLGSIRVNRSLFEIESFLVDLRKRYQVNDRIDTSIVSDSILQHFDIIETKAAFRPPDFQLNFLHYLVHEYAADKELYELVDGFIQQYKSQLRLPDIIITKTGATRCKTNTRFAVDSLRDLGLILSRDQDDRRTWSPSIGGLIVLINIRLFNQEFINRRDFKSVDSLLTHGKKIRISISHRYDPTLIYSIQMFKDPTHLYSFLSRLHNDFSREDRTFIEQLFRSYIDFVEEGLEITDAGIRITKTFKELSEKFLGRILFDEEKHATLHAKLYQYFRSQ